jgi:hypothetical protein
MVSHPLPPVANTAKAEFLFTGGQSPRLSSAVNILYLQWPSPVAATADILSALANGALTWWGTHFKSVLSVSAGLTAVRLTMVDGSGTQGVSTGASQNGTAGAGMLPPQCTACISWLGAPAYRGGKPRTYFPFLPDTAISPNTPQLTGTYANQLKTAANAALADESWTNVLSVPAQLGTVSYIKKALNPTPPYHRTTPLFWQYLGCRVHERLDSQRRRSGKEGSFPVA